MTDISRLKPLTDRDFDVLNELAPSYLNEFDNRPWQRPLDIGASNGSHHSPTLAKLEKRGLVESKQRSWLGSRGSKVYRVTDAGWTAVQERFPRHWQSREEWATWFEAKEAERKAARGQG